jgi:hypothetical protein
MYRLLNKKEFRCAAVYLNIPQRHICCTKIVEAIEKFLPFEETLHSFNGCKTLKVKAAR